MVTCLVIDFKAGVEAQPLQQLRKEIAFRVSSSQFCHGAPNHKVVVVKEGVEEATGWELGLGAEHEEAGEGIAYCILGSFATQKMEHLKFLATSALTSRSAMSSRKRSQ